MSFLFLAGKPTGLNTLTCTKIYDSMEPIACTRTSDPMKRGTESEPGTPDLLPKYLADSLPKQDRETLGTSGSMSMSAVSGNKPAGSPGRNGSFSDGSNSVGPTLMMAKWKP